MNYEKILAGSKRMETIDTLQNIKDYKYIYTFKELANIYLELRNSGSRYDSTPQFLAYLENLEK